MDYAFGEQAYETIDELLKPYKVDKTKTLLNVESVSIMGKAGILEGGKGDIMIPNAHVNEGTADNYHFENELTKEMFEGNGIPVFSGPMITVLGTSLQNRDYKNQGNNRPNHHFVRNCACSGYSNCKNKKSGRRYCTESFRAWNQDNCTNSRTWNYRY
jgi:hypothetical protein